MRPQLCIIAGSHGGGKTTFAKKYLPQFTGTRQFVNGDEIASRLSPDNPAAAAICAEREMLSRIRELSMQRVDFAIETTLSGKSYLPLLRDLRSRGYEIHLHFLWLADVQLSAARVADRARKGGHHIPLEVIHHRYKAGIINMFQIYRTVVDSWTLFDNSGPLLYTIAAEAGDTLVVLDENKFAQFMKTGEEPRGQTMQEQPSMPEWMKGVIAMRQAMLEVVEEHSRTGHPLLTWRDGKVFHLPPEEARQELETAARNDPWTLRIAVVRG